MKINYLVKNILTTEFGYNTPYTLGKDRLHKKRFGFWMLIRIYLEINLYLSGFLSIKNSGYIFVHFRVQFITVEVST